ncbi:hypothetical protein N658DRAFT_40996 [Parathielavia hyrcaniae]|uniref:Uncharacterized protein n=1 Tax=Parathielavia hyrcaniae TaxID=113614 RepID=A0AAN6Q1P2_9PEZI|nr:hypothetical protein N658DRAFT_40996 [Parathielavia hyrcaniae]
MTVMMRRTGPTQVFPITRASSSHGESHEVARVITPLGVYPGTFAVLGVDRKRLKRTLPVAPAASEKPPPRLELPPPGHQPVLHLLLQLQPDSFHAFFCRRAGCDHDPRGFDRGPLSRLHSVGFEHRPQARFPGRDGNDIHELFHGSCRSIA